ncbi:hypothetical protein GCM10022236_20040 [Microlunatus ginsengisoli]|uniref:Secreted protein n=1 Tax=Microlunatus ginsengisoli TaxID=363863 RepID=A0ABP6ZR88_9ACTN
MPTAVCDVRFPPTFTVITALLPVAGGTTLAVTPPSPEAGAGRLVLLGDGEVVEVLGVDGSLDDSSGEGGSLDGFSLVGASLGVLLGSAVDASADGVWAGVSVGFVDAPSPAGVLLGVPEGVADGVDASSAFAVSALALCDVDGVGSAYAATGWPKLRTAIRKATTRNGSRARGFCRPSLNGMGEPPQSPPPRWAVEFTAAT